MGKVGGAKTGEYFRDYKQSLFKTVEFGLFPFVPFSQAWNVEVQNPPMMGSKEFYVAPQGTFRQEQPDTDWQTTMGNYASQGFDIEDQLNNAPAGDFAQRAARLAKELGEILDGDSSPSTIYETTEQAELEERILIDWFFDGDHGWTAGDEPWRVANFDGRRRVAKKQTAVGGREMLDMMASSEKEADYTEYALHRLAYAFGREWVDDVQGIEMTKEVGKKYLQQIYIETRIGEGNPQKRLQIAGEQMAREIMREYNEIGGTIIEAVKTMPSQPDMGPENIGYIAKQVLDRLAEITHRVGSTQASYVYQVPIVSRTWKQGKSGKWTLGKTKGSHDMLIGFIRLTPVVRGGSGGPSNYTLTDIAVSARVKDLSEPPAGMSQAQWVTLNEMLGVMKAASRTAYGTFSQWLMQDAAANVFNAGSTLAQMNDVIGQGMGLWGNFQGKRQELLGSSLWSMVENISRGMVGGLGDMRAVDVLTTREIALGIEKQFKDFLDPNTNTGLTDALREFYENAVTASNRATDAWKGALNPNPSNLPSDSNPWRRSGVYDAGGRGGRGIGAPFFLFSGRDDSAFLKFKERVKGGAKSWIHLMHRPSLTTTVGKLNPEAFGFGRGASYAIGGAQGEIGMMEKVGIKGTGYGDAKGTYEEFYERAGVDSAFDLLMEFGEE